MDTLIISKENNILHIFNKGYSVDYTIYNSKGHSLDGGVLESSKGKFENNFAIKEITNLVKEHFSFNSPYMYLCGERAETLLELIEIEDYKQMQSKVSEYLSEIKEVKSNDLYIEKER